MTHYPFPDSRGTKIAFAAFFTAMLFLARDSMFTTAVIGFEKAQFLMLGVICLLGVAFLIVNRRNLLQILKDRRMIVAGIAAAVLLLPMLVKRDWQLMYFSVLLCLLTAVFLSYFLTLRDAAKYYVVIMSVLGAYSVLAAYILRIGVDSGAYAVPVFRNSMGFEFHNFFLSIVPDTYVKNRNFGIFREPGVYQFFLITALYLNNYEVEWKKTWQLWLVNGILAATMVGLILCVAVIAGVSIARKNVLYWEVYDMAIGKFVNGQDSSVERMDAIVTDISIFLHHPIFGAKIAEVLYATANNTTSTLILFSAFGIPAALLHIACWVALVWRKERKIWVNLALVVILFMSFNTQNLIADVFLWLFPVMALVERLMKRG